MCNARGVFLACACLGVLMLFFVGVPLAWGSAARTEALAASFSAAFATTIVAACIGATCFTDYSVTDWVKVTVYVDGEESHSFIAEDDSCSSCLFKALSNFLAPGIFPVGIVTFLTVFPPVYMFKAIYLHEYEGVPLRAAVSAYFVGCLVGCALCTLGEACGFMSGRFGELMSYSYDRPDRSWVSIVFSAPFIGAGCANWVGWLFFLIVASFGTIPLVLGIVVAVVIWCMVRDRKKSIGLTNRDITVITPDPPSPVVVEQQVQMVEDENVDVGPTVTNEQASERTEARDITDEASLCNPLNALTLTPNTNTTAEASRSDAVSLHTPETTEPTSHTPPTHNMNVSGEVPVGGATLSNEEPRSSNDNNTPKDGTSPSQRNPLTAPPPPLPSLPDANPSHHEDSPTVIDIPTEDVVIPKQPRTRRQQQLFVIEED